MGAAMLGARGRAFAEVSGFAHAIAMHGAPALPDGFAHFPYADPMARRGGRLTLGVQGTFDSLNPLIVQGNASDVVPRFVLQSLMMRSHDEPFRLVRAPRTRSRAHREA